MRHRNHGIWTVVINFGRRNEHRICLTCFESVDKINSPSGRKG
jgi:hypothetical protein